MNKVLKKVGLSAVVATFVFGLASTSSALVAQDPDNETAVISTSTDVFVVAQDDASYSETENYSLKLDNTTGNRTGLTYTKDFNATNGQTHVKSTFDATENASTTKPNIKTSNKVTFNAMYEGINEGTFTATERIAYQRCQPAQAGAVSGFCGGNGNTVPTANGDVAMGIKANVNYAAITTGSNLTAVAYSDANGKTVVPNMAYNIDARGLGIYGQNDDAIGSVSSGMKANIKEVDANNNPTTSIAYERHTSASGYVKFTKSMAYKSQIKNQSQAANINSVP